MTAPIQHIVLVVDDEPILRLNASEAFRDAGCTTYEAGEAEEALAVLAQHPDISVLFTAGEVHPPEGYAGDPDQRRA